MYGDVMEREGEMVLIKRKWGNEFQRTMKEEVIEVEVHHTSTQSWFQLFVLDNNSKVNFSSSWKTFYTLVCWRPELLEIWFYAEIWF